jgi:hypothetical protein
VLKKFPPFLSFFFVQTFLLPLFKKKGLDRKVLAFGIFLVKPVAHVFLLEVELAEGEALSRQLIQVHKMEEQRCLQTVKDVYKTSQVE